MRYCHSSSVLFHSYLSFERDATSDHPLRQISLSPRASRRYRDDSRLMSPSHSTSTKQSGLVLLGNNLRHVKLDGSIRLSSKRRRFVTIVPGHRAILRPPFDQTRLSAPTTQVVRRLPDWMVRRYALAVRSVGAQPTPATFQTFGGHLEFVLTHAVMVGFSSKPSHFSSKQSRSACTESSPSRIHVAENGRRFSTQTLLRPSRHL
ncbi:unnamed protein product [Dicrocoelium dendriticum]|nr:unnamed protein product [Dicrocoelium dendriticum]